MNNTDSNNSASKLTIVSANVNGLNDTKKRGEFFMHIRKFNPSIICLCDTRLSPEKYESIKNEINMSCN